jgi:hypothetical protein
MPRFGFSQLVFSILVLAIAAGARAYYVASYADNGYVAGSVEVQGSLPLPPHVPDTKLRGQEKPNHLDNLVHNLTLESKELCFATLPPLAQEEEKTAHVAPGYYYLVALAARWSSHWFEQPDIVVRWAQCGLGAMTAFFYFFFARRAFRSTFVGLLAGVFCALHPFWVFNTTELADGVLASFLLGAALMLGARGSQVGGPITSLLFGLCLAGLAMVRAALLPFAVLGLLWFLLRCKSLKRSGWFCALLAVLGFANGLAPWAVRNYQVYHEIVPVADSAFLNLWIGNNPKATGGNLDETALRASLGEERLKELLTEPNQARRYAMLGQDVLEEVKAHPMETLQRRLWSGLYFIFGESFFKNSALSRAPAVAPSSSSASCDLAEGMLAGSLLAMLLLSFLGWRWSYAWRRQARLATFAVLWIPLPYVLTHAEYLCGPRLPFDGILLCLAAFALASLLPGFAGSLAAGPQDTKESAKRS